MPGEAESTVVPLSPTGAMEAQEPGSTLRHDEVGRPEWLEELRVQMKDVSPFARREALEAMCAQVVSRSASVGASRPTSAGVHKAVLRAVATLLADGVSHVREAAQQTLVQIQQVHPGVCSQCVKYAGQHLDTVAPVRVRLFLIRAIKSFVVEAGTADDAGRAIAVEGARLAGIGALQAHANAEELASRCRVYQHVEHGLLVERVDPVDGSALEVWVGSNHDGWAQQLLWSRAKFFENSGAALAAHRALLSDAVQCLYSEEALTLAQETVAFLQHLPQKIEQLDRLTTTISSIQHAGAGRFEASMESGTSENTKACRDGSGTALSTYRGLVSVPTTKEVGQSEMARKLELELEQQLMATRVLGHTAPFATTVLPSKGWPSNVLADRPGLHGLARSERPQIGQEGLFANGDQDCNDGSSAFAMRKTVSRTIQYDALGRVVVQDGLGRMLLLPWMSSTHAAPAAENPGAGETAKEKMDVVDHLARAAVCGSGRGLQNGGWAVQLEARNSLLRLDLPDLVYFATVLHPNDAHVLQAAQVLQPKAQQGVGRENGVHQKLQALDTLLPCLDSANVEAPSPISVHDYAPDMRLLWLIASCLGDANMLVRTRAVEILSSVTYARQNCTSRLDEDTNCARAHTFGSKIDEKKGGHAHWGGEEDVREIRDKSHIVAFWSDSKNVKWQHFKFRFCGKATEVNSSNLESLMNQFVRECRPSTETVLDLMRLLDGLDGNFLPVEKRWVAKFGEGLEAKGKPGHSTLKGLIPIFRDKITEVLKYKALARKQKLARMAQKSRLGKELMRAHALAPKMSVENAGQDRSTSRIDEHERFQSEPEKQTRLDTASKRVRSWGWGWGVVWDVAGVVGPGLYAPHVASRISAADAIQGATIALLQKVILSESRRELNREMGILGDEQVGVGDGKPVSASYEARIAAAVQDVTRVVASRWREELDEHKALVRWGHEDRSTSPNFVLFQIEYQKELPQKIGRILLHSSTRDLAHRRDGESKEVLWSDVAKKTETENSSPTKRVRAKDGTQLAFDEGMAGVTREDLYKRMKSLVPHIASLGWLNRQLQQGKLTSPETLRTSLLHHRAQSCSALEASSTQTNVQSASKCKEPNVLSMAGQRRLQALVDVGLDRSAVALLHTQHADLAVSERINDQKTSSLHVCGALCAQIGLEAVHEQHRREVQAIDAVLAVSNALLQRHFDVFRAVLVSCFGPVYWNHQQLNTLCDGPIDNACLPPGERIEEEWDTWGQRVRTVLGWGQEEFHDDLWAAKRYWSLYIDSIKRGVEMDGQSGKKIPFKSWYLTEWRGERVWPSSTAAARLAQLLATVSFHSSIARREALRAITNAFADAPMTLRSRAALDMSAVALEQDSMQSVRDMLENAVLYGASAEDFAEKVAQTTKPTSYVAEPEFVVSPLNCWLDGALVVKPGVSKDADKWRMDADSLVEEPPYYVQFAARHEQVAQAHEKLMHRRAELVEGRFCLAQCLQLDLRILSLDQQRSAFMSFHDKSETSHSDEAVAAAANSLTVEAVRGRPRLVFAYGSQSESDEEDMNRQAFSVLRPGMKAAGAKWRQKRQDRAGRGGRSPAAIANAFAGIVLGVLSKSFRKVLLRMRERLSTKETPFGDTDCGGEGSLRERARKLIQLIDKKHQVLRQEIVLLKKDVCVERAKAAYTTALQLKNLSRTEYASNVWNTPLGGLPFDWGARQIKWSVRVQTGIYNGGHELCDAITRALSTVAGMPPNWRLVAKYRGRKGPSAQIEIKVDRNMQPLDALRQRRLRSKGISGGWSSVKCFIRLLFASGMHARSSIGPILSFRKSDTSWAESITSNGASAASMLAVMPRDEFIGPSGKRFFLYRTKHVNPGANHGKEENDEENGELGR